MAVDYALTTSYAVVTGLSLSVVVTAASEVVLVHAAINAPNGGSIWCRIYVDGVAAGHTRRSWVAAQLGHNGPEILFKVYARYIPNKTRRDGWAFIAKMEGDGPKTVIQGRQVGEIRG